MENLADFFTDAFSETSVPSFRDEDLDFESLSFDDQRWREETEDTTTGKALLQEAAAESGALLDEAIEDVSFMAGRVDEEKDGDEPPEVNLKGDTPERDCTSSDGDSDQEGSVSGEAEEVGSGTAEEPGELLMEACCSEKHLSADKEDKIFTEGRPLDLQHNEVEGDEDVGYFGGIPERGSEMTMMITMKEDEQEREADSSESEKVKEKHEESAPSEDERTSLTFPDISLQYLQDLIAEVDSEEECVEKIAEFSGEEHQEAGESFADYPSDFSSCEYAEGGRNDPEQKMNNEPFVGQNTNVEEVKTRAEDFDDEKEDEILYSIDLKIYENMMLSPDEGQPQLFLAASGGDDGDETEESGSSTPSDDDQKLTRTTEEPAETMSLHDPINTELTGNIQLYGEGIAVLSRWGASDDHHFTNNRDEITNLGLLKTDSMPFETLSSTEELDKKVIPPSYANHTPDDDLNTMSTSQNEERKEANPSNQGSIDDDFLFENEQSSTWSDEQGELGDDEDEKDRWEQEHERIEAFYRFYNDSEEDDAVEERQTKVQFCSNPLSQVIHYDNESDRDSDTSSSNRDEDFDSAGGSEELIETEDTLQIEPASDPPTNQQQERAADVSNTPTCTEHHESPQFLKLLLKMIVVMVMGLLMFYLTTDRADWFSQFFFL
ncbi:glutamic acid-rich protein isoform X2 [Oryzias latipes]|uniref:glutamic acid-rich protein isoform X2 n=1 Tax=Oryzias latipes TaxID=8090 RepID=UPI0005CC19AE|nr:glutamic acid-rich protein isoform X2 [Oryzias latipes]